MDPDLHVSEIVTAPFTFWAIGIVIWFVAAAGRRNGKGGRWKWILAYGIVLFSAWAAWSGMGGDPMRSLGMGNFWQDSVVRSEYSTNKLLLSLYASFFGPILTIPVLALADRYENKRMRDLVS